MTLRNFFSSVSFIVSVQVCTFPLNMCDIIIYVTQWWEKHLSKRSLLKHTYSRRDKLIILWTLNRQTKIFLPTPITIYQVVSRCRCKVASDSIQMHVYSSICTKVLELLEKELEPASPIQVNNSVEIPSLNGHKNWDKTKNMSYDDDFS